MKLLFMVMLSFLLVLIASCNTRMDFTKGKWIDLSHEFSSETIYWPTEDSFSHDTVFAGITPKGYYYTAFKFQSAEHGGTHIDAPIHFSERGISVDQIPIDQLIGKAVVVNVIEQAQNDADYQISIDDFRNWEENNGKLPTNCIILLNTGYARFWPDRVKYMGTNKLGKEGVAELHFPGLGPDAANWLVQNRKIKAIGLDTPSIDYGQSQLFESHQILSNNNIPVFENVTNVDKIPVVGTVVFAFPMKIKGGSGAPLRIVAFVPEE